MGQGELSLPPAGSMLVPNPYTHNPEPSFPPVLCVRNVRGDHISFRRQESNSGTSPTTAKAHRPRRPFFRLGVEDRKNSTTKTATSSTTTPRGGPTPPPRRAQPLFLLSRPNPPLRGGRKNSAPRGGATPMPRRVQPLLLLFRSNPPTEGGREKQRQSVWVRCHSHPNGQSSVLSTSVQCPVSGRVRSSIRAPGAIKHTKSFAAANFAA